MSWSGKTRTAQRSMPASIAATSSRDSGLRQSIPVTSAAKAGCNGRNDSDISSVPRGLQGGDGTVRLCPSKRAGATVTSYLFSGGRFLDPRKDELQDGIS